MEVDSKMKEKTIQIVKELYAGYPALRKNEQEITRALEILLASYQAGNKLLICGNGGSAADSEHIVGELMKGFRLQRPLSEDLKQAINRQYQGEKAADCLQGALPAISLSAHTAFATAFCNDVSPEFVYAQQVLGYGKRGDVLLGITTSGNSRNVVNAVKIARAVGVSTIGLTGENPGQMKQLCDVTIAVPEAETYRAQELHVPVYHALCAALESENFQERPDKEEAV